LAGESVCWATTRPVGNPAVAIIVDDGRTLALSRLHLAAEGTEGSSKKLPFAASQKH
jgi:hypothetical protein